LRFYQKNDYDAFLKNVSIDTKYIALSVSKDYNEHIIEKGGANIDL
jgi:hypothetical protein